MGGAIARHDLRTRLGAANVETLLYGLYLGRGEQLVDNHTAIYHDHPNCRSWEVYKGILDGRVARRCSTERCSSRPRRRRPTRSRPTGTCCCPSGAKVDTKPQLEIFADDVKCTHGATVGSLDETCALLPPEPGHSRAAARRLLTYAFAAEVVAEVASEPVRAGAGAPGAASGSGSRA